ncbi:efflux transporter outer membrane subunit [Phenylobacterium sp.]|jgi:NodT family efflux transporter outer membrane factor (OMF) lipoprotein|uniref:efflux transporter outer membrane subunit n=1 Tax=Phenylobacterium sp. TaxID=1871053 RepID=UPI002E3475AC|nr:efflux transporter outer membrane subunit [Phenylobacterium sp.]HEX3365057.1 efflux transporter outer membrane subunit [Phenylobacterium sp.]
MNARRRLSRALAATALAMTALTGCVVGPKYAVPAPPAGAAAPLATAAPAAADPAAPPDAWWRLYADPHLDAYVAEAFAANTDLKAAEDNLSGARAVLQAAKAGRYPGTTLNSESVYGRDPATDEILEIGGHKPESTWLYEDTFQVSYEIDLFGRVRRAVEASRADAQATAAARDLVKTTVAAETARAYGEVCALGAQLAVARRAFDLTTREAQITHQRREAGSGTQFDVARSEGLAAQARAAIPPLEGQRRAALFQLAAVLGRTPANAPEEALACETPPRLTALIPVGDGADLLRRRPDVREAERRLAAATARVGVVTADLYPRVALRGFYGGAAVTLADLTRNAGLIWGVGPSISWTFPNQAGPRARVRQAQAGASAALDGFDSVVLRALKEAEQTLAIYSAELDRRQALGEVQARAQEAFRLVRGDLEAGAVSPLDVLVAEQTLIGANAAVAQSDAALVQDQIAVFKALGGGWQRQT